jgi:acyl-CoA-dependent ceramide synthase
VPYFVVFIGIWAYMRHYLNLRILASLMPGAAFQTVGPYELDWAAEQFKCWLSQTITVVLLASLQAVNLFWFFLILRILVRFVQTGEEKDVRSEDEDEAADAHEDNPQVVLNGKPMGAPSTSVDAKGTAAELRRR